MTDDTVSSPADEPVEKWDPKTDPDGYTWEDVEPKDWYLDTFLSLVTGDAEDRTDSFVSLTVISNGVVVSGHAISRQAWVTGIIDQFKQSGVENSALAETFAELHDGDSAEVKHRLDAKLPVLARQFLHMKDVRIGTGPNAATVLVPFWRGALSDVTGWAPGSWNSTPGSE